MVKSYLLENYGYNEPVSLNELSIEGLSENAVRQSVKRLVANGFWKDMTTESTIYRNKAACWERVILIPFLLLCANM